MKEEVFSYDDKIVRLFILATIFWGGIAFAAGLLVALQLSHYGFNFNLEWLTFGRLRPIHTNAAIFAFAGNTVFAGIYYSTQRLLKTRLYSDFLSQVHFWGWQLIIVFGALTLFLGFSQGKEYAELEWPLDIAITLIWVLFAINFFGSIAKRRVKHLYVAIWFYIATILTVAVLHIVNSIEIPVSFLKSYPIYAGIQDALVQWWYGHNAVAFFLTTPFLGLMYYFIPKIVNKPVYSYRLSIIHFWSLVFIYIWAGPHHLLYTALPDWLQTLGVVFSVMLWMPSWGGMINGLLTLRGAWDRLRTDPILKFFVVSLTFYGMATFEGPLLSIKAVSDLGHYTDWIVGHVHAGTLGWNSFMAFGMIYYLVPKLWNTKLYSQKLATNHFWLGFLGILLYYISMVTAGITQGLMWRSIDDSGMLVYPDFVETIVKIVPLYHVRSASGIIFIIGFSLFVYNIFKTIRSAAPVKDQEARAVPYKSLDHSPKSGHQGLEEAGVLFAVLTFIAILVGSIIEIYPTLSIHKYVDPHVSVKPYSPLELAGRDVYVKEGCYTCHSQMIRSTPADVLRFGERSTIEDSMYDRPFQWGSKRIGPDLARVGGRYPDVWHFKHLINPRDVIEQSLMPNYDWLLHKKVNFYELRKKLQVMKYLGVPYSEKEVGQADLLAEQQAQEIVKRLKEQGVSDNGKLSQSEMVALIAYLQSLGRQKEPSQ